MPDPTVSAASIGRGAPVVTSWRQSDDVCSRLAREAEAACAEQTDLIAAHSYRTWMFGTALAREELDRELFYCAALVHDWGATKPVAGEDFTYCVQYGAMVDGAGLRVTRAGTASNEGLHRPGRVANDGVKRGPTSVRSAPCR
jgi:hypothetical protein